MKKFKSLFWIGFIVVGSPIIIIFFMFIISKLASDKHKEIIEFRTPLYDTIKVEKKVIIYDTVKIEKSVKPKKVVLDSIKVVKDSIN
jgi:hypothetical protein